MPLKPYAHVGYYGPDRDVRQAERSGTFTVVDHSILEPQNRDHLDALAASPLDVILNLHLFSQDLLLHPFAAPEWQSVHHIYAGLHYAGLLRWPDGRPRLLALLIYDEPFMHLHAGDFQHWPALAPHNPLDRGVADAFSDGLSQYAAALKAVFPGVAVGSVDGLWVRRSQRSRTDIPDEWYCPVPPAFDFVGLDVYCPSPWREAEAHRLIADHYGEAAKTGKPILAVPQMFADQTELWRDMPTLGQMVQQLEWISAVPSVVAIAGFCLSHPHHAQDARCQGLMQHPWTLPIVEAYADFCRQGRAQAVSAAFSLATPLESA